MEAVSLDEDVASGLAWNQPRFCFKKSPDRGTIGARSRRDRATIECRSCRRFLIKCHLMKLKIDAFDSAMPELQFGDECATIAHELGRDRARSGHNRALIVVLCEAQSTVRSLEAELDRPDVSA